VDVHVAMLLLRLHLGRLLLPIGGVHALQGEDGGGDLWAGGLWVFSLLDELGLPPLLARGLRCF
jgi:hypothetical protein